MADPGDIWQRYDAKVVQIQVVEARLAAVERELGQVRDERDHWARICRDLGKKLSVARNLAERLRNAERLKGGRTDAMRTRRPGELQAAINNLTGGGTSVGASAGASGRASDETARAREVLGVVLMALTRAFDDNDPVVLELGRRLRQHAGGKLLYSLTHGSLTLVPVDGRYMVDRQWLAQLDLDSLRRELDVGQLPGNSLVKPNANAAIEVDVDLEPDDYDAGKDAVADRGDTGKSPLPPPPPLAASGFATLPPLISALPEESSEALPRPDTLRATNPLGGVRIPNLSLSRLVKTPRTT